ncbi:MAG: L,D-transpeptidase family protein [Candidatus Omnitrophota bacterium]
MRSRILFGIVIIVVLAIIFGIFFILKDKIGSGAKIKELTTLALSQEEKQDFLNAKISYQKLITDFPNSRDINTWQKKLDDLNIKIIYSNLACLQTQNYEVKTGDSIYTIAKKFHTTPELITKSNKLKNQTIYAGRKLRVWTVPFSIAVDKSQNTLILKAGDEIIKTYIVSTGTNNSTPVGTFKIKTKLVNPIWYKEGLVLKPGSPENILGTRWMGFDLPSYGIHGTTQPESLGKQATQGCVRMANPEVEELYDLIPLGTEVIIVD